MIIDKILDRKDGAPYKPKKFYDDVSIYGGYGFTIANMMDSGEEKDVKKILCQYIKDNDYDEDIITYINSVDWL